MSLPARGLEQTEGWYSIPLFDCLNGLLAAENVILRERVPMKRPTSYRALFLALALSIGWTIPAQGAEKSPVFIGLDAEFGYTASTSAEAIREGAGSTDRTAIRMALEQLGPYQGLIKEYRQPFTATRHEALVPEDVFMARYADDGAIVRIPAAGGKR